MRPLLINIENQLMSYLCNGIMAVRKTETNERKEENEERTEA